MYGASKPFLHLTYRRFAAFLLIIHLYNEWKQKRRQVASATCSPSVPPAGSHENIS